MAIVKMKRLRLVARREDRVALLTQLQRMGCVELDEPTVDWKDPQWASFTRPESDALARARQVQAVAQRGLHILTGAAPEKGGLLQPLPLVTEGQLFDPQTLEAGLAAAEQLVDTERHIATCRGEQTKQTAQMATLAPWLALPIPLETQGTALLAVHLGTIPAAAPLAEIESALLAVSDLVELVEVSCDREQHYLQLLCHVSAQEAVLTALRELGWSKANFRGLSGMAQQCSDSCAQCIAQLETEIQTAQDTILALAAQRASIQLLEDAAAQDVAREAVIVQSVDSQTTFFLEGWIPADQCQALEGVAADYACAVETEEPSQEEYSQVPIKLKNNWFTGPLNMVTEMYSLPAYGGLDPNPLMAPFFILFYGVMLADMGYGLLMILAGALVLKKKRPKGGMRHFAGLALLCGISTFIMGAITGGFFGDFIPQVVALTTGAEITLPRLFSPLDDALMVLIGSLVLGVIQIITAMIVSMVKQIRRGQTMEAICNEGAWFAIFITLGLGGALGQLNPALAVAGIILVVTQSYGKKGVVAKLMAIFGSLYNNVTGYFSDILSYSRLMALMLAGAVIAQVFNTLGALTGNIVLFLIISLVGNALNFGLNLLGCYVHDLRLQCLEYFGRFYEDGGRAFSPLELKTKHVDIQ